MYRKRNVQNWKRRWVLLPDISNCTKRRCTQIKPQLKVKIDDIFGLSVCLYPIKRQNGWTDQNQILCGASHNPRKGIWMLRINYKYVSQKNFIFVKFWKSIKKIWLNPGIIFRIAFIVQRERCSQTKPLLKVWLEDIYLLVWSALKA